MRAAPPARSNIAAGGCAAFAGAVAAPLRPAAAHALHGRMQSRASPCFFGLARFVLRACCKKMCAFAARRRLPARADGSI
jgi:hypothetical protein